MPKNSETELNALYPADVIGLVSPLPKLRYRGEQNYEDKHGNRIIEENGRFFASLLHGAESRYYSLVGLPVKGSTLLKTFVLKTKNNFTGQIVAAKTGPLNELIREAEVLANLDHQNINKFLEFAVTKNTDPCIMMEWLSGGSLEERINEYNVELSKKWIASTFNQAAEALIYTNDNGYVHGDVKPSNMMFDESETLKVIDYGNSFPIESGSTAPNIDSVYTVRYASPEQTALATKGKGRLHIQSDIYSLAATLFDILTFKKSKLDRDAFVETEDLQIPLRASLQEDLSVPQLHNRLAKALRRALALNYKERPLSVEEFNSEIQDILA